MSGTVRLLLSRHGRTVWHRDNRYAGRTDVGLDEVGYREARALARRARRDGLDLVLCSPLGRALETARPAAEVCDVPLETDGRLLELDFGAWEGRTREEIREEDPESVERFEKEPGDDLFPGGEPLSAGARRAVEALGDLYPARAGQTVLVVAHNTLLRLGLCALLGIPLEHYRRRLPRIVNAAVSEVRLGEQGAALLTLNDSRHLEREGALPP